MCGLRSTNPNPVHLIKNLAIREGNPHDEDHPTKYPPKTRFYRNHPDAHCPLFSTGRHLCASIRRTLGRNHLIQGTGFWFSLTLCLGNRQKPDSIGFHIRRLGESLLIGGVITALPFIIAYSVEWILMKQTGQEPKFLFAAIDPKAGVTGGILFALWLVVGNFINSFMEEGLFRGVMLNLYRLRLSLAKSNGLQALLFGSWHLIWVVKWYQTGIVSTSGEIGMGIVANFLPQICLGLVWGYAYLKTDNLWTAWFAHTLTNTTLNLLHVATFDAMDPWMSIRMTTFSIVSLLMMFLIRYICNRWNMPELSPWKI
jgi:membrane protease YdiL (CAAX protease family)